MSSNKPSPFSILIRLSPPLFSPPPCPSSSFVFLLVVLRRQRRSGEKEFRCPNIWTVDREPVPAPRCNRRGTTRSPPSTRTPPAPVYLWKIDRDILCRERTRAHGIFRKSHKKSALAVEFARARIASAEHAEFERKGDSGGELQKNYVIVENHCKSKLSYT